MVEVTVRRVEDTFVKLFVFYYLFLQVNGLQSVCFFKAIYPTNCLRVSLKLQQFVRPIDVLVCQEEKNDSVLVIT